MSTAGFVSRRDVILITGISGSGKSVALHALEDAGYLCVDNLPPELLRDLLRLEMHHARQRVAVAMDVRASGSLQTLPGVLKELRDEGLNVRVIFLDASTDALVHRFSETRRRHPLSRVDGPDDDEHHALIEAIELERQMLTELRELATVLDTSLLRATQLRGWVRQLVHDESGRMTLVFESFAYKHGVPRDADYVFDLRVLPNPHYIRELRPLTGEDAEVARYLDAQPEVQEMLQQIGDLLEQWLPAFEHDQRAYVTVAMGCTGGQHRSVYSARQLAARFEKRWVTLVRHRELDGRGGSTSKY